MCSNIILLVLSPKVQADDLISCDISCDHSHILLHCQSKRKRKENQKKRNIKSRKINKRKRKILVSKHTITGELKQCSTVDTGVALTYFIYSRWVKNINTSTLAFNIAQFFPFLNHQLLSHIFDKVGFKILPKLSCRTKNSICLKFLFFFFL